MARLVTEMLKGTLEGIVLAILSGRPAYGYEITAWLREQGFSDIAEGTIYALLIRVEQRGLVFLPVSNRLQALSESEVEERTLVLEGILSIQAGDNPRIVQEKLDFFREQCDPA